MLIIIKGERDVLHQVMAPTSPTSPLISNLEHLSMSLLSLQDNSEFFPPHQQTIPTQKSSYRLH